MIKLTKIIGEKFYLNAEEIEIIETAFDTTITLRSGRKISVVETGEMIEKLVIEYKQKINEKL
jgi:flagellar protein FlbD